MNSVRAAIYKLFLEPRPVGILNGFRIFYCLGIALNIGFEFNYMTAVHQSRACPPIPILSWIPFGELLQTHYEKLILALIIALVLAALGLATRYALSAALILFILVIGPVLGCDYAINPTLMIWHHAIVVFNLFVLIVSPNVGKLNLIRFARRQITIHEIKHGRTEAWPETLLKFNLIFSYFSGGCVKLRNGLEWLNGYTLQKYFMERFLLLDADYSWMLAQSFELCVALSILVVILEIGAPLSLLNERLGYVYAAALFLFQGACFVIMKVKFINYYGWSYGIYLLGLVFYLWRANDVNGLRQRP